MARPPVVHQKRRLIVAVAGDSNLNVATLKPHRLQGDEQVKEELAYEVCFHPQRLFCMNIPKATELQWSMRCPLLKVHMVQYGLKFESGCMRFIICTTLRKQPALSLPKSFGLAGHGCFEERWIVQPESVLRTFWTESC